MDEATTGKVTAKVPVTRKTRTTATVFHNNSGVAVTSAIQRLMGEVSGFKYVLESIVNNADPSASVKAVTRIEIDIRGLYDRANQFDLIQKLNNRLTNKFMKLQNMEVKDGMFIVLYENKECLTSVKDTIKYLKEVHRIMRVLDSVTTYINNLITKKNEREQVNARKKAERAAAKMAAATAIPGATAAPTPETPLKTDAPVTTLL